MHSKTGRFLLLPHSSPLSFNTKTITNSNAFNLEKLCYCKVKAQLFKCKHIAFAFHFIRKSFINISTHQHSLMSSSTSITLSQSNSISFLPKGKVFFHSEYLHFRHKKDHPSNNSNGLISLYTIYSFFIGL